MSPEQQKEFFAEAKRANLCVSPGTNNPRAPRFGGSSLFRSFIGMLPQCSAAGAAGGHNSNLRGEA
jgi:hypothetical protein